AVARVVNVCLCCVNDVERETDDNEQACTARRLSNRGRAGRGIRPPSTHNHALARVQDWAASHLFGSRNPIPPQLRRRMARCSRTKDPRAANGLKATAGETESDPRGGPRR